MDRCTHTHLVSKMDQLVGHVVRWCHKSPPHYLPQSEREIGAQNMWGHVQVLPEEGVLGEDTDLEKNWVYEFRHVVRRIR